ncbi:TM0106 family RecB-like putative nuclease [Methylobacterium sp. J-077]|uniref:TM0106 family RecB-like putative nuclease n=1 Tax=Methylobacterium sp. J-077 TaxID=2836656 RepID=UPI001FBB79D4|nr:TM0106 family RecB-like putative nuclease [Methylobacterium sp. J-077]MCJ2126995.1 TM0106 family RecB-like putative nuclease [Methylobacterium sp. J-077]
MPTSTYEFGRLSPTFLATFLGCATSAAWTLEKRRGLRPEPEAVADAQAALIQRKGQEHEDSCLAALAALHGPPVAIARDTPERCMVETRAAMDRGAPLIAQAALADGPWIGYADFLVRVEAPCPTWAWSYEPWDAKLAHTARPEHVMQIALYGDLLARVQGRVAEHGALMLGSGDATMSHVVERFRLADVRHYVRRAARRLEVFAQDTPVGLQGEPCGQCGKCEWGAACDAAWAEADHLCRVADISRRQRQHLLEAQVSTAALLGGLGEQRVTGIGAQTLTRLVQQARLQRQSVDEARGVYELLAYPPGLGFDRLPPPHPDDLFFDFEGDPMHPGGLEYLCGVLWRARPGDGDGEPVPGHPELRFLAVWAHDRAQEKRALRTVMDFLTRRLSAAPGAHLYHYAPYEKTALRRLASMHAVAETAVDDLLREGRMVDLYRVVREGVRVGEASYSIKSLERFYMPPRTTEVTSGGDSLVLYDRWRTTGDASALTAIHDYNRDDCLSTLLLRDWLLGLAEAAGITVGRGPGAGDAHPDADEAREIREQREREQAELEARVAGAPGLPGSEARQLMADLVGFHRREQKPAWWAYFDRQERGLEELQEDEECLAGCRRDGEDWLGTEARSFTYRFHYPEQETKLRAGSEVCLAAGGASAGEIIAVDEARRLVTLKRGKKSGPPPEEASFIPGQPFRVDVMRQAVWTVAADLAAGGAGYPHIAALLRREPPRLTGRTAGSPVIPPHACDDPTQLLAAAIAAVRALDRSWLVIQGPPGAGKTYTISHLIAALIADGKTVGIASNSHKAIDNVLHAVETRLHEAGQSVAILGQKKDGAGDDGYTGRGYVASVTDNKKVDPSLPILAGTAWLFAREELWASRDVLFVDEAGQVSLGNLVAMAQSARALVLVGDQMQLAQPIQGAHPRDSGVSALDHLLEGYTVVPPERGIFLARTWRMHPDLCGFVSAAVYDGQLRAEAGCARQRLVLGPDAHPALKPAGLAFRPVAHMGCRQKSEAEADEVRAILASLLGQRVVDRRGVERAMTLDDVLVVAPYNMQVNLLKSRLPQGARVGTVDRFQGQEAEIVVVSMATSGAEDMPRDAAFLLSRNRFNVAISRARCLAVLIASPGLLDLVANSVEEMRLANLFCWAAEASG